MIVKTIASSDTIADLLERLGGVPPNRVRATPPTGTATVADVIEMREKHNRLCELIDGVLVEKAVGATESRLAIFLAGLLNGFVIPRNVGFVLGPDGAVELLAGLVRIPDVAFIAWDRAPGRKMPTAPVPHLVPNLVVEVLSASNTPGEMAAKRQDYFGAGVEIVWEIDHETRTVAVFTSPTDLRTLTASNALDGGTVLPGFQLPLGELFGELDRQG
jgi:Uma2 family endonuclease